MTREEAINELAGMYRIAVVDSLDATVEANKKNEAIDIAISALQAQDIVRQWRDIINLHQHQKNGAPVPVVRCRDCKHYDRRCFTCENDVLLIKIDDCGCHPPFRVDDDWFCADGERRAEDGADS